MTKPDVKMGFGVVPGAVVMQINYSINDQTLTIVKGKTIDKMSYASRICKLFYGNEFS